MRNHHGNTAVVSRPDGTGTIDETAITFLHLTDSDSPLLAAVHRDLITPHFTDVNDVDTLLSMQTYMTEAPVLSDSCVAYAVVVMFSGSDTPAGATIFGIFSDGSLSFIKGEYTIISPHARSDTAFRLLLGSRYRVARSICGSGGYPPPAFTAIEVDSDDFRLCRLWRRHGFRRIAFPFVQLPLRDDLQAVTGFSLYLQPHTAAFSARKQLYAGELSVIIDASCTFRKSSLPAEADRQYIAMQELLQQRQSFRIEP